MSPSRRLRTWHCALGAASALALGVPGVASAGAARHTAALVTVTFTDSALRASPTAPSSGKTTFRLVNRGKKAHVLVVEGPGLKTKRTRRVRSGARASLTVTLRPGTYVLSDPALGPYKALFLDVIPAAQVSATGSSSVVEPPTQLPPMCGVYYTP